MHDELLNAIQLYILASKIYYLPVSLNFSTNRAIGAARAEQLKRCVLYCRPPQKKHMPQNAERAVLVERSRLGLLPLAGKRIDC